MPKFLNAPTWVDSYNTTIYGWGSTNQTPSPGVVYKSLGANSSLSTLSFGQSGTVLTSGGTNVYWGTPKETVVHVISFHTTWPPSSALRCTFLYFSNQKTAFTEADVITGLYANGFLSTAYYFPATGVVSISESQFDIMGVCAEGNTVNDWKVLYNNGKQVVTQAVPNANPHNFVDKPVLLSSF